MDCHLPGSSVHGIFPARILQQVAMSSFRGSSRSRYWTKFSCISCTGRQVLYHWETWEASGESRRAFFFFFFLAASQKKLSSVCLVSSVLCLVTRSCLTLCNPMDYSPPGSSFHGILQERILEWVAILFSRGFYWPSDWTQVSCISSRFSTVWVTREALVYTVSNQMIF